MHDIHKVLKLMPVNLQLADLHLIFNAAVFQLMEGLLQQERRSLHLQKELQHLNMHNKCSNSALIVLCWASYFNTLLYR